LHQHIAQLILFKLTVNNCFDNTFCIFARQFAKKRRPSAATFFPLPTITLVLGLSIHRAARTTTSAHGSPVMPRNEITESYIITNNLSIDG
jgi:hypothetical protein